MFDENRSGSFMSRCRYRWSSPARRSAPRTTVRARGACKGGPFLCEQPSQGRGGPQERGVPSRGLRPLRPVGGLLSAPEAVRGFGDGRAPCIESPGRRSRAGHTPGRVAWCPTVTSRGEPDTVSFAVKEANLMYYCTLRSRLRLRTWQVGRGVHTERETTSTPRSLESDRGGADQGSASGGRAE